MGKKIEECCEMDQQNSTNLENWMSLPRNTGKAFFVKKWLFSNICMWIRVLNSMKDPCFLYAHWQNKLLWGGRLPSDPSRMKAVLILTKWYKQALQCNFIHSLVLTSLENLVFRQTSAFLLTVNVSKLEMERTNFHLFVVCCEWHCWSWLWVPDTTCLLN